jgi:hypothetical protein
VQRFKPLQSNEILKSLALAVVAAKISNEQSVRVFII